jgi:hypothetical protein
MVFEPSGVLRLNEERRSYMIRDETTFTQGVADAPPWLKIFSKLHFYFYSFFFQKKKYKDIPEVQ